MISVNGKPEPLQSDELKLIKSELRMFRDRCTQLLDQLDARPVYDAPSSTMDTTVLDNVRGMLSMCSVTPKLTYILVYFIVLFFF